MTLLLSVAGAACCAAQLGLMAYGRTYLAALAGWCCSGCMLGAGILGHSSSLAVLSAVSIGGQPQGSAWSSCRLPWIWE
jgi:hypothetical protein